MYNVNACFFNHEITNMDKVERIQSKKEKRFTASEYLAD